MKKKKKKEVAKHSDDIGLLLLHQKLPTIQKGFIKNFIHAGCRADVKMKYVKNKIKIKTELFFFLFFQILAWTKKKTN